MSFIVLSVVTGRTHFFDIASLFRLGLFDAVLG